MATPRLGTVAVLPSPGSGLENEESLHAFVEERELQRRAKGAVSLRRRRMWACLGDEKRPIGILPFPNIWDQPQYRSGITQRRLKVIPCSDRIVEPVNHDAARDAQQQSDSEPEPYVALRLRR